MPVSLLISLPLRSTPLIPRSHFGMLDKDRQHYTVTSSFTFDKMRGSRDKTRTIERKLGFFTENGLRRVHNAYLHPSLKKMLSGMDEIKKEYVEVAIDEIRTSQSFARAWHNLFDDIGPSLWPTATSFDAGPMQDPELYPRRLEYHNIHDRVLSVASA